MEKKTRKIVVRIREVGSKPEIWNEDFFDEDTGELVTISRTKEAGWIEEFNLIPESTPEGILDYTVKTFNDYAGDKFKKREWVSYRFKRGTKEYFNTK